MSTAFEVRDAAIARAHDVDVAREEVVAIARTWIGTPFQHGARIPRVAVDCAQLLVATYVGAGVVAEPPAIAHYSKDWFLHERTSRFVDIVEGAGLVECGTIGVAPGLGDVVLFRYGRCASHGAVIVSLGDAPTRIVHAFRGRGVVEDEMLEGGSLEVRRVGFWTPRAWHGARAGADA